MQVFEAQFTVNGKYTCVDHETESSARAAIEANESGGSVVGFNILPDLYGANRPYCFKMDVFEDGAWRSVNIHGG